MIVVRFVMTCQPGKSEQVLAALQAVVPPSRALDGVISFDIGRDVAVKVQYPGVAEAVETDMRNVQMLIPLLKRMAPGMDAKALLGELRERISEELDYEIEAVFPGPQEPPGFRKLSPLGRGPAYRDGERTLADSSIICAYIERTAPAFAVQRSDSQRELGIPR